MWFGGESSRWVKNDGVLVENVSVLEIDGVWWMVFMSASQDSANFLQVLKTVYNVFIPREIKIFF